MPEQQHYSKLPTEVNRSNITAGIPVSSLRYLISTSITQTLTAFIPRFLATRRVTKYFTLPMAEPLGQIIQRFTLPPGKLCRL
jgi:hypothetical protein